LSRHSRGGEILGVLRNLALSSASALVAFAFVSSPGCGTSAMGVEDCRDIEQARCDGALACGTITDAAECKRFYRDHCLHGLPMTPPPREDIDNCIAAIKNLTLCANAYGPSASLAECPAVPAQNATRVCEVMAAPERAYACSFLTGTPVSPPAAGGQGGQGGSE
jgi:hypothetical protein